eukprot:TRINITY_DN44867_c0_g1_i1.p4 TRINITY_DN44867_c0_g1~~TRINITY_DN44867_c0_g1_i1.p4  ORF type:complete len:216 (+),score=55.26 TRINITY_DN44867_c0_g1_i1:73-648(+)
MQDAQAAAPAPAAEVRWGTAAPRTSSSSALLCGCVTCCALSCFICVVWAVDVYEGCTERKHRNPKHRLHGCMSEQAPPAAGATAGGPAAVAGAAVSALCTAVAALFVLARHRRCACLVRALRAAAGSCGQLRLWAARPSGAGEGAQPLPRTPSHGSSGPRSVSSMERELDEIIRGHSERAQPAAHRGTDCP